MQAPGYVNTAWGTDMPWPVRMLLRAIQPFFRSIEDCGEAMCVPIFTPGTGLTLVDKDGSPTASVTSGHTPAARDTLWAHTLDVLRPFTPAVVPGEAAAASEAEVK